MSKCPAVVLTLVVDRQRLSSIAHSRHPIAAPVSGVNANRLLRRADQRPAARILDLGCGEAAWALQALAHCPDGHADGVDISRYALERAAEAAAERGLADRLTLHERDARRYAALGDYDLVMCVGSAHAFGGFDATVRLAGRRTCRFWLALGISSASAPARGRGRWSDLHIERVSLVPAERDDGTAGWSPAGSRRPRRTRVLP